MKKKLTKAQESRLHYEFCVDDLLWRKHQDLMHRVREEYKRLIVDSKRIRQVIGLKRDGSKVRCEVADVVVTPYGTDVFVCL